MSRSCTFTCYFMYISPSYVMAKELHTPCQCGTSIFWYSFSFFHHHHHNLFPYVYVSLSDEFKAYAMKKPEYATLFTRYMEMPSSSSSSDERMPSQASSDLSPRQRTVQSKAEDAPPNLSPQHGPVQGKKEDWHEVGLPPVDWVRPTSDALLGDPSSFQDSLSCYSADLVPLPPIKNRKPDSMPFCARKKACIVQTLHGYIFTSLW